MIFFVCLAALMLASSNAAKAEIERSQICQARNSYYIIESSCDSYIECRDYVAHEMLCPDGLHFDPAVIWPRYPCAYPSDVSCAGRGTPQPPQATEQCPHRYGFFASPMNTDVECGHYRMCVEGNAIDMMCPTGLAFNPETARCGWPESVASCNAEAFLGFRCPEVPLGLDGEMPITNYRYDGNCFAFFSCEGMRARLLTCDAGMAFDEVSRSCVDADLVKCGQL